MISNKIYIAILKYCRSHSVKFIHFWFYIFDLHIKLNHIISNHIESYQIATVKSKMNLRHKAQSLIFPKDEGDRNTRQCVDPQDSEAVIATEKNQDHATLKRKNAYKKTLQDFQETVGLYIYFLVFNDYFLHTTVVT